MTLLVSNDREYVEFMETHYFDLISIIRSGVSIVYNNGTIRESDI